MDTLSAQDHCKDVQFAIEKGVRLSPQAVHILNNSQHFDGLGRIIFLDRYSLKSKRDEIGVGDCVIAIVVEDYKFPKKEIGIVKAMPTKDKVVLHMVTGLHASEESNYELTVDLLKCDKPVESIDDALKRVARAAASVEKEDLQDYYFNLFYEQLANKHIQPAGRIMTGANVKGSNNYTRNLTLYNCYVLPSPKDSRYSIINETFFYMMETMARGGGVGINLSSLRPKYAYVRGVHGKSSGAVSWGGLYSFGTGLIEQGGSRRGALMLMMEDWHPDIIEFIQAKTQMGRIENANISVLISDPFMEAVKQDKEWNLAFPDYEAMDKDHYNREWDGDLPKWKEKGYPVKVYKTVRARDMWDTLIRSAHSSAEPGIVFLDRYNTLSNSWYFNRICCTNPCGEQGLPGWGVCNLGHLYLASFARQTGEDEEGPLYEMDWDALKRAARTLNRFLDNVIDLNPYHFEAMEKNQKSERRVGGGTLGLGELLIKLRVKYGSPESIPLIEQIYKTIATEMYKESCSIAQEKGSFAKFDSEKFLKSGFMKQMPDDIREMVKQYGIRNVTLTTQAPTGTVGSMLSTSTGIEPFYSFEYYQQSRLGFHKVLIRLAEKYKRPDGSLPDYFVGAMDLKPLEHVRVQAAVQRWTDSSISKTANAPNNFTVEQTKQLYEHAYDLGCKGVTIYRDGCRNEQALSLDADAEKKNAASARGELDSDLARETVNVPDESEYGAEVGQTCPQCREGTMVKLGGCTECSNQCGFKGSCDMK
ncbi:adenosylcobalamin-dependent ribonucleoside-diphosphate reductase [Candidatus Woesearchaeota archaeon]|nr:adenosylcobalamin-dependent ribonucleoside-diphosphate reductase [Candidatus Woesearchaeota archaeon]